MDEEHLKNQTKHEKRMRDELSSNRSKYGEKLDIDTLTKEWKDDNIHDLSIQLLKLSELNEAAQQIKNGSKEKIKE